MNNPFIINAIAHVREFHPEVTMVVFNKYGQWQYMDDNFDSPIFGENIKQYYYERFI